MREEKKIIVNELLSEIKEANPLIFTDYSRVKAIGMNQLRSQLRTVNSKYRVVQNTLFGRALSNAGLTGPFGEITGPLAIAYGGRDAIEVVKALIKFAKDNPNTIVIRGGFVDKQYLGLDKLQELSRLPSREVLLARLTGQLNAPISKFVMVLQGNIQKLVCVLEGITRKKPETSNQKPEKAE